VRRTLLTLCALAIFGLTLWAQAPKDTPSAAATRKKLQAQIKVDFKEAKLKEVMDDIKDKIKDKTGLEFSYVLDSPGGVSQNISVNYKGEGTVEKVFDEMLGKMDMGYIVISGKYKKLPERYDGWVLIVKGKERGYPEGVEPKETPAKDKGKTVAKDKAKTDDKDKAAKDKAKTDDKDKAAEDKDKGGGDEKVEEQAANALKLAKKRIELGLKAKAKESLQDLIKQYPKTKAAEEARELVKTLK
jgi:hypothetical protein